MKIAGVDLVIDKAPELDAFQTLKRVASGRHATYRKQLGAWMLHLDNEERASRGLRAARNRDRATEQYFAEILDSLGEMGE